MKYKSCQSKIALACALSGFLLTSLPANSETGVDPYYSSQAQADIGYMTALHESDLTNGQLQQQMNTVRMREAHLGNMQATGSGGQIHSAKIGLQQAESNLTATMSQMAGVSESEIKAMHNSGMTWGQVSNEMGLQLHDSISIETGSHHSGSNSDTMVMDGTNSKKSNNGATGMNASNPSGNGGNKKDPNMPTDYSGNNYGNDAMNISDTGSHRTGGNAQDTSLVNTSSTMRGENSTNASPASKPLSSSNRLSPMVTASDYGNLMQQNQKQLMTDGNGSYHNQDDMFGMGATASEMNAATARDMMNGGVIGHGTGANSDIAHEPGTMMSGTAGLSNGMGGSEGAGGMGGSSGGGMGSADSGMGGSAGGGTGGGMGGSDGGTGGSGGGSGGGMM